jgi:hypothetical protein
MEQYNITLSKEQLQVVRHAVLFIKLHTTGQTEKDRDLTTGLLNLLSSVQSIDTPEWQRTSTVSHVGSSRI